MAEFPSSDRPMSVAEYARYRETSTSTIRRRLRLGMPHRRLAGMPTMIDPIRADHWHVNEPDPPPMRRSRGRPPSRTTR